MTVLKNFLSRNQITPARPLPLVHTTASYFLKKIVNTNEIKASPCNVFKGENLTYLFVGRAAYKQELHQESEYWELPSCVVMEFFSENPKRVYPFDSGAFNAKRYPKSITMMDLKDFETRDDPAAVEKLIGTFFGSAKNYYTLQPRSKETFESVFDVDVLDEEIKALYSLILSKSRRLDDRRFAIEMQISDGVDLQKHKPILFILPETYLSNSAYVQQLLDTGAEILTYPLYPLRKEYYYMAIYERLDQYYRQRGYYGV